MQWYILAWIRVFTATGDAKFLTQAEDIFGLLV